MPESHNHNAKHIVGIVDDEPEVCCSLAELFRTEGIECIVTDKPEKAIEWIHTLPDLRVLITDVRMPGINGLDLLRAAGQIRSDLAVIVMTGYPSVENAVSAMKLGAINFFSKPIDFQKMFSEVTRVVNTARVATVDDGEIITRNQQMRSMLNQLEKTAQVDVPVVILGESGTGKELFARRIHHLSSRRDNAYVCVNCAALPESLLESELFGHEKGAFTGAGAMRRGRFELADKGTLFLDEIGDMPLSIQAKLLRAIEQRVFERLGGEESIQSDIRFIAATNKDLQKLIASGSFREDFYYRLSVVVLNIPPLRERSDDIPLLVRHFIGQFNALYGKSIEGISDEAEDVLLSHDWPGNVRELRNCIQRAAIFRNDGLIEPKDLPGQYATVDACRLGDLRKKESRRDRLREVDRELIQRTLDECDGVKSLAAERLRIHRKTLYNRMKSLGLGD